MNKIKYTEKKKNSEVPTLLRYLVFLGTFSSLQDQDNLRLVSGQLSYVINHWPVRNWLNMLKELYQPSLFSKVIEISNGAKISTNQTNRISLSLHIEAKIPAIRFWHGLQRSSRKEEQAKETETWDRKENWLKERWREISKGIRIIPSQGEKGYHYHWKYTSTS